VRSYAKRDFLYERFFPSQITNFHPLFPGNKELTDEVESGRGALVVGKVAPRSTYPSSSGLHTAKYVEKLNLNVYMSVCNNDIMQQVFGLVITN